MKVYRGRIDKLSPYSVFVFGSNTEGRHGKGAALWAVKNAGAIYGQAQGWQGQSYAIVTKNLRSRTQPSIQPIQIITAIRYLYGEAEMMPTTSFLIAYSGKGTNLNGYSPDEMAEFFARASSGKILDNIIFEEEFAKLVLSYL